MGVSIQKADVKLDETEEEKKRFTKVKDMYKPLTDWWKDSLTEFTEKGAMKDAGVKIEKVEISKRLTESPVVVVTSQFGVCAAGEGHEGAGIPEQGAAVDDVRAQDAGDQPESPSCIRPLVQGQGRQV